MGLSWAFQNGMTLGIWSKNVVSRVVSKINKKLGKVEMLGDQ